MEVAGARFYYSRFSAEEKAVYDGICDTLRQWGPVYATSHYVHVDATKIMNGILCDNPEFFYVDRHHMMLKHNRFLLRIEFHYTYDRQETQNIWQRMTEVLEDFESAHIKPDMRTLQKQIEIHRFLMANVRYAPYPSDDDCHSIVGALLRGVCVCEGFAKAYKLMCDRLKIASIVVMGTATDQDGQKENHMWNITRIDGVTAHTDVTWDAAGNCYDYFNLCDEEIAKDHEFKQAMYPGCPPNRINYFHLNKAIVHTMDELRSFVAANRDKEQFALKLTFDFDKTQLYQAGFAKGALRINYGQGIVEYTKE